MAKSRIIIDPVTGVRQKVCPFCHKTFDSTSRARYCCPEHQKLHAKAKKKRRKEYVRDVEGARILSLAYSLAHAVAEQCVPKPDDWSSDTYELHHLDGLNLNNNPFNLRWVKKDTHVQMHTVLPKVNSVAYARAVKDSELWADTYTDYNAHIADKDWAKASVVSVKSYIRFITDRVKQIASKDKKDLPSGNS